MPKAEIVAARLQQRRWLGTRPGKAADRLALEERSSWSEPLALALDGTRQALCQWRAAPETNLYRAPADDRLKIGLIARWERHLP